MAEPDQIARFIGALGVLLAGIGLCVTWYLNRPRVKLSTEFFETGENWSKSGELQLVVHITNNSQTPIWAEAAFFGSRWGKDRTRVTYYLDEHSHKANEQSDRIRIEPYQSDYFMFVRSDVKQHPGTNVTQLKSAKIKNSDTLTIEAPLGVKHRIRNAHIRQFAKGTK
jgi:hypothetical protein